MGKAASRRGGQVVKLAPLYVLPPSVESSFSTRQVFRAVGREVGS